MTEPRASVLETRAHPSALLKQGRAIYSRFQELPGSQHIAKPAAIAGVLALIRSERPATILEIGSGIGTLTYAIVSAIDELSLPTHVVTVESDGFCLEALRRNLGPSIERIDIRQNTEGLEAGAFDVVLVDGGTLERGGYSELVAPGGVLFVEGFRGDQRRAVIETGRACAVAEVWFDDRRDGGYWLFKFEPTPLDRVRYMALGPLRSFRRRIRRRLAELRRGSAVRP